MKYVDVIVDNNTDATDCFYTYKCPFDEVKPGASVMLPFSIHNRKTVAYVAAVREEPPEGVKRFKQVSEIIDNDCLTAEAMDTAVWMRSRCLCRYIEAVKCFLPGYTPGKRKIKDPFENVCPQPDEAKALNGEQSAALDVINGALDSRRAGIYLLHGVTGAGKTEVYLQAAARCIEQGRQIIVLVPEISLTPQTVSRFMSRFGRNAVAVIHSRLTPAQKGVEYAKIRSGSVKLVIGARSAVFAPFENIGLIIVDEEHESSYKSDHSPKYSGIDVAARRAMKHGAVLVLGSATPSIEDYHRARSGVFGLIELKERYNKNPLPVVETVDMSEELRHGNRGIISQRLAELMQQSLERGRQIILFLNRRGYSSYISCRDCGYVINCGECGISMTWHKAENACICHYCGRRRRLPEKCPQCGSTMLSRFGSGTEQLEEKVAELFPDAKAERLDMDTTSKKGSLEAVLSRFESRKTDILIGTQIVAKGLDFSNVDLVGIVNADVSLNIPDFRSQERCFQLVTQAAGRSGRGEERGRVVIQSSQPDAAALVYAADHDYTGFYEHEIRVRMASEYPPFSDIYQIVVLDADESRAHAAAERCARWLRRKLGPEIPVLGPAPSVLRREDGRCRYQVLIKAPAGSRREVSQAASELRRKFSSAKDAAELLTVDINPFSFM